MNNFRVLLSITLFITSFYLVYDLIFLGFDWFLLLCAIGGFVGTHYLWPAKHDEASHWYDSLEYIIELPFRTIALFIRSIGAIFKNADSGIDL
jgi:hypothetical protein